MAARRLLGRVAAVHKREVLVDVPGLQPKFPLWMTRLKATLPPGVDPPPSLGQRVAIEGEGTARDTTTWIVAATNVEEASIPPLPVHPVNSSYALRQRRDGTKEVNNVGRYYAAKWEARKAARVISEDREQGGATRR